MYFVALVMSKFFCLHSTGLCSGALVKLKSVIKHGFTERNQKTLSGKINAVDS